MSKLLTWRNLTALRKIAADNGVIRPNTKHEALLLEELAQKDVSVSEVCLDKMVTETTTDAETATETSEPEETVTETPEPEETVTTADAETIEDTPKAVDIVQALTVKVNRLTEDLAQARKELNKANNDAINAVPKRSLHELLQEQREQDATHKVEVDKVAAAQRTAAASRSIASRKMRLEMYKSEHGNI